MIQIKTFYLDHLGFWLSEAFNDGKQIAFSQGDTAKSAEWKLRDKLKNYYHFNLKQKL